MKKLVLALLVSLGLTVSAQATGGDLDFCERFPTSPICGTPGIPGPAGEDGTDGTNGTDGSDGAKGDKGDKGVDGSDGTNHDANAFRDLQDFALDSSAGNIAVSAIDFGTTCKGKTEVGIGVGYADSSWGSSTAAAVGLKHGLTDDTAVVVKAWSAGSESYGIGAGATYAF